MKKRIGLVSILFVAMFSVWAKPRGEVTILYTNDVHTYIANTVKDANGTRFPAFLTALSLHCATT